MTRSNSFLSMTRRQMLATSGAAIAATQVLRSPALAQAAGRPVVRTAAGDVAGEAVNGVNRFLGIRYAQPISGANRFLPPQPVAPWDGVYEATRHADISPQGGADPTGATPVTPAFANPDYVDAGDDCLALSVWTPEGADGTLPVMVWLHGGGWTTGAGSCAIYDGQNLASRGDVVVVTINHRLGASGLTDFSRIVGGDYAGSANLSVQDMLAALEWVNTNIAGFGGNPELVTIFGESGGGWKVNTMQGVPAAEGLFHRAIVESGPLTHFYTTDEGDAVASAMLDALGLNPETAAEGLANLTHEQVVEAEAVVAQGMGMSAPGFPMGFWPVIDGSLIQGHVFDGTAAPSSLGVPLLIGQTGTEFSLFMLGDEAAYELDDAGVDQRIGGMMGAEPGAMVLATYRADYPDLEPSELYFRIFSDFAMGVLSLVIADTRVASGAAPTYAYRFDWNTPIEGDRIYSPHTIEIPFVFDNATTEAGVVMTGGGDEAAALAATVSEAWVQFAKTGVPSAPGLPEWPVYTPEGREAMHLDTSAAVAPYMPPELVEGFKTSLFAQAGRD
ncbi:MAG: carboxylesterase family protein [Pseudomonadota bacterium]|nr:carboxylesterase family protein [Pseudomonadota bacterium]